MHEIMESIGSEVDESKHDSHLSEGCRGEGGSVELVLYQNPPNWPRQPITSLSDRFESPNTRNNISKQRPKPDDHR